MMSRYFLGFDTSNYTTSVAVVDEYKNIVANERKLLKVKFGHRGLRQQEALFQHIENLPELIERVIAKIPNQDIKAFGVSSKPRSISNSYMPCFKAGISLGKSLSAVLNVPYMEFSHQEGHIAAVAPDDLDDFFVFHLSGGTSELLYVKNGEASRVGGSLDISFGQLIDRVGVALGYEFPAGKSLDEIACCNKKIYNIKPIKVKDSYFNLSGVETKFLSLKDNFSEYELFGEMFFMISECIIEAVRQASTLYNKNIPCVLVGGVASSKYIRKHVEDTDKNFIYGDYSTDNAVGIALLTRKKYLSDCSLIIPAL